VSQTPEKTATIQPDKAKTDSFQLAGVYKSADEKNEDLEFNRTKDLDRRVYKAPGGQLSPLEHLQNRLYDVRDVSLENTSRGVVNNNIRISQTLSLTGDALNIYVSDLRGINKRSTASWVSMAVSALATVVPFKPQSQEEIDRYNDMSLPKYVATRIGQAVLEPTDHITQTIGLSQMVNGLLYTGAAFDLAKIGQGKTRNGIIMQGGLTALAGATLLFHKNVEKAWQWSSGIFYTRYFTTVPNSYQEMQYVKENPVKHVATGEVLPEMQQKIIAYAQPLRVAMQFTGNTVGFLYGGAYKDKDGNIVYAKDEDEKPPEERKHKGLKLLKDDASQHVDAKDSEQGRPDTHIGEIQHEAAVAKAPDQHLSQ